MRWIWDFMASAWMFFAVFGACVMTYGLAPWICHAVVGAVIGFFAGRHYEYMQPARFHGS